MADKKKKAVHLTRKQKADICAAYATGATYQQLGDKYGCNKSTIMRVIKAESEFATCCEIVQKEAEEAAIQSMDEYVRTRANEAQEIIGDILASFRDVEWGKISVRDRAGAVKIMRETFVPRSNVEDSGEKEALNNLADALNKIAGE